MEEHNHMLYNVLLQADLDDMFNLCHVSHMAFKICHDPYFLNNKFDMLKIYKPMLHTFNNLLYINSLIQLSIKLIDFMKEIDGIRFDFLNLRGDDKAYIIEIKKFSPDLYDQLIAISNDLTSPYITMINVPLNTKPILTDPFYGHIEFLSLMYKDNQYYLYTDINFPHFIESMIPIEESKLIEYVVNIFLNYDMFYIGRWGYLDNYIFNKSNLEKFLLNNPNDIEWEEA